MSKSKTKENKMDIPVINLSNQSSSEKKNRTYGVKLDRVKASNLNMSFDGEHNRNASEYEASAFSTKHLIKRFMRDFNDSKTHPVFNMKNIGEDFQVLSLRDRYFENFGTKEQIEKIKKEKGKKIALDKDTMILNLMRNCVDIANFGIVLADSSITEISLTGVVQFTDAINLDKDTNIDRRKVLSPSPSDNAEHSTVGSKSQLDEACFGSSFSINPLSASKKDPYIKRALEKNKDSEDFKNINGLYTQKCYELFKEGLIKGTTYYKSCSKSGNETLLVLIVDLKENSKACMSNLHTYISYYRDEENKSIVDMTNLCKYLKRFESEIENIEIHYNDLRAELILEDNDLSYNKYFIGTDQKID